MRPLVSFVIPCYKLADFLPECVNSILSQTYTEFEILIMDDASPDSTPEVAVAFTDPRVKHIRNDPNLGHLLNYNKGIELAKGDYIWLISADDRLRVGDALQRYIDMAEQNPTVGYVFCPAVGLVDGQEAEVEQWTSNGQRDFVMSGRRFLAKLVHENSVAAPSGMVRRECYEKLGAFPLDLPYAGDWYLWCLFALHFDVAYIAEPLVNYRLHAVSMTNRLTQRRRVADDLAVCWRIQSMASELGYRDIVEQCTHSLAHHYAYYLTADRYQIDNYRMTMEEFEQSLQRFPQCPEGELRLRARVCSSLGDGCYRHGDWSDARHYYRLALKHVSWMHKVRVKTLLLGMGKPGRFFRQVLAIGSSVASLKKADQ